MKHLMIDAYGCTTDISSLTAINEAINTIIIKAGLCAVMPPENIPFYYCEQPTEGGVSSYCILDIGHITIHTFPFHGCYYMDIMYEDFDTEVLLSVIHDILPAKDIRKWDFDRSSEKCDNSYEPDTDFGPHLLAQVKVASTLSIDDIYHWLDRIPQKIGMNPIIRPRVITNRINNYNCISGLTLIAESHISVHFCIDLSIAYIDIYSCHFCNPSTLIEAINDRFGCDDANIQLISRGSIKDMGKPQEGYSYSNNRWKENI